MSRLQFAQKLLKIGEEINETEKDFDFWHRELCLKRKGKSKRIFESLEEIEAKRNEALTQYNNAIEAYNNMLSEVVMFDFKN